MEQDVISLNIVEAIGLPKICDAYCTASLLPEGVIAKKFAFSPRGERRSLVQLVKTETCKRSNAPKWRLGQAELLLAALKPAACLDIVVFAVRMLGSEALGRVQIPVVELRATERSDKWYSLRNRADQESGSVRVQLANKLEQGDSRHAAPEPPQTPLVPPLPLPTASSSKSFVAPLPDSSLPGQSVRKRGVGRGAGGAGAGAGEGAVNPFERGETLRYNLADPTPSVPQPAVTFQFKVGDLVGKGAFGKVYQAMNLLTGELMAVKCVDLQSITEEEQQEIKNEVLLLRSLKHAHIVQYIGTHQMDTSLSIFMEFCPGGSVASLCQSFGGFPEPVVAQYTRQVAEGLAFIHSHAVMHRDIKGANLLVAANGVIKIADFGASAQLRGTMTENADTCSMRGTPYWMAPEVIKQERYGRAADCWSMGMTMIEMATGTHPWKAATNKFALLYEIASTDHLPDIPSTLSSTCRDLILRTITRNPEERISAAESLQHPFLVQVKANHLR